MPCFKPFTYICPLFGSWALASCSLAPEVQPHTPALPQSWELSARQAPTASIPTTIRWWQSYGDKTLNILITKALDHNSDIQLAAARVEEARASTNLAQAQQSPNLSGQAGASRSNIASSLLSDEDKPSNSFMLGGLLSYEVDIWGRLANSTKATRERLLSIEENARTVKIGIETQTTSTYFALIALNEQIALTRKTVEMRHQAYNLEKTRLDKGDIDALSLSQTQAQLTAAQVRLPGLERQRDQYLTSLSVLLGQTPAEVMASLPFGDTESQGSVTLPPLPPLPEKAPEQILSSRPDIMAAEHTLQAANADIGVARAAYLPQISLSGLLGVQSAHMDDLFNGTTLWNAGANVSMPLLDFGRARAQVAKTKAREKQAYLNYEKTVRSAFGEVKNALTVRQKSGEEYQALTRQTDILQTSSKLASQRFEAGYSGYIDVLDAKRSLFDAQIAQIDAKQRQLQASIDLFRALGED